MWSILVGPIMEVLKRVIPDADARATAQEEITKTILSNEGAVMNAAREIISAEAQSNWYVSAWRPTLMYLLMAEIIWLSAIAPILGLNDVTLDALQNVPGDLWNLLMIGMGGYIIGRSGEKIAGSIFKK